MAQAPEVTKARVVKVRAHTRRVAARKQAESATGQRMAGVGTYYATQAYKSKTPQQRQLALEAARRAGAGRSRTQRTFLGTHGAWVSPAGQGRGALARRYASPEVGKLLAASQIRQPTPHRPITDQTLKFKFKTDKLQQQRLQASIKNAKPPWFNTPAKSAVLFTMNQLLRPSSALGALAKSRIEDTKYNSGLKALAAGAAHPQEHAEDWNAVPKALGVKNKTAQSLIGLGLSVGFDPTTYFTGGTSTGARAAGEAVFRRSIAAGMDVTEAARTARAAAAATGAAGERTGVKVGLRFRKHGVMTPPMGGATKERIAAVARKRGVRHVGGEIAKDVREGARQQIGNPNVRPRGWSSYDWEIAKMGGNSARAMERRAEHRAGAISSALQKATKDLPPERHQAIIDALERVRDLSAPAERAAVYASHGLDQHESRLAEELFRIQGRHAAQHPLVSDIARPGVGLHPKAPSPKAPITRPMVAASREAATVARQRLADAQAEAAARAAARKGKKRLPELVHGPVDQAQTAFDDANRRFQQDLRERARQTKAQRDYERQVAAFQAAPEGNVPRMLIPDPSLTHPTAARTPDYGPTIRFPEKPEDTRRLAEMSAAERARYEQSIPALYGAAELEHGRVLKAQEQHKWMAALADPVDMSKADVKGLLGNPTEHLFVRDERGMHPLFTIRNDGSTIVDAGDVKRGLAALKAGHEISRVDPQKLEHLQQLAKGGRSVKLPDTGDLLRGPKAGRESLLARTHRTWKWWATAPNLSYHARNAVGDSFNAMTAGTTAGDFRRGFQLNRANNALVTLDKSLDPAQARTVTQALRDALHAPEGKGALDALREAANRKQVYAGIGPDPVSDLDLIEMLNKHGAINTGIVSGELRDLQLAGEGPVVRALHLQRPRDFIQQVGDYRENVVRLATAHNALEQGMTLPEAAAYSLRHHIDYSNISQAEAHHWRYIFPFWTWWSRNLPLQVTKVLTRPGIYANIEKARRQTLNAMGSDPNIAAAMQDYEQENLPWGTPFHTKVNGKKVPVVAGPGLPYMDLGSIPIPRGDLTTTLRAPAQDLLSRSNALVKGPAEALSNLNFYTLNKHEDEQLGTGRYVPAPSFLPYGFPGVKDQYDPKTGKMVKMVNWRVLTLLGMSPVAQRAGRIATPENSPGKPTGAMIAAGWLTGPRYAPADPRLLQINQLRDQQSKLRNWIEDHKGDVKHRTGQPWSKTPGGQGVAEAYKKIAAKDKQINELKKALGQKNVRQRGRPRGGGKLFTIPGGSPLPSGRRGMFHP